MRKIRKRWLLLVLPACAFALFVSAFFLTGLQLAFLAPLARGPLEKMGWVASVDSVL
jgi:hypothetical protein